MFDEIGLAREFFERLTQIDTAIVARAAAEACRFCGGPLHRGDYGRKPRGGLVAIAAEAFTRRFSLCCGREGCRRRATPPSVRFLGRRVYVGVAVIVASVVALAMAAAGAIRHATGISPRTIRRWLRWWQGPFVATPVFVDLSARVVPAIERARLPSSMLERLDHEPAAGVQKFLTWLAPLTTASLPEGSRLVRGVV